MGRGGSELQDMITGALSGDATEPERISPLELFVSEENRPAPLAVARGREVADFLLTDEALGSPEEVRRQITEAAVNYMLVYRQPWGGIWEDSYREAHLLLIGMSEYLDDPNREALNHLQRVLFDLNNLAELEYLQCDFDRQMGYLDETFGDDLLDRMTEATRARRETAKRWISGDGIPSPDNRERIAEALSVIHALRTGKGMDSAAARDWFSSPHSSLEGGVSPIETMGSRWDGLSRVRSVLDLLPDRLDATES